MEFGSTCVYVGEGPDDMEELEEEVPGIYFFYSIFIFFQFLSLIFYFFIFLFKN